MFLLMMCVFKYLISASIHNGCIRFFNQCGAYCIIAFAVQHISTNGFKKYVSF